MYVVRNLGGKGFFWDKLCLWHWDEEISANNRIEQGIQMTSLCLFFSLVMSFGFTIWAGNIRESNFFQKWQTIQTIKSPENLEPGFSLLSFQSREDLSKVQVSSSKQVRCLAGKIGPYSCLRWKQLATVDCKWCNIWWHDDELFILLWLL